MLSVADVDGDDVRCRWAERSQGECASVCRAINATLFGVKLRKAWAIFTLAGFVFKKIYNNNNNNNKSRSADDIKFVFAHDITYF